MNKKFLGYIIIFVLLIFSINNILVFLKKEAEYKEVLHEYVNLEQTYKANQMQSDQLEVGDNKERYFKEQYGVSKKDEILFKFPEVEDETYSS